MEKPRTPSLEVARRKSVHAASGLYLYQLAGTFMGLLLSLPTTQVF